MKSIFTLATIIACTATALGQISFSGQGIGTSRSDRAVVDMNGDFLDDIVSVATSSVQVFYQQANGSFMEEILFTSPADNLPSWSLALHGTHGIQFYLQGS